MAFRYRVLLFVAFLYKEVIGQASQIRFFCGSESHTHDHFAFSVCSKLTSEVGIEPPLVWPNLSFWSFLMNRWAFSGAGPQTAVLFLGLLSGAFSSPVPAQGTATAPVECIMPDGRPSAIVHSRTVDPGSAASIVDDSTVSCPLREGDTTFVIALATHALRDRFTFINENAAACGELKIAVADSRLAPDSPKWTPVDGIIPFSHKRLFNLSMLGVDTTFVRLTFHVESTQEESADSNVARRQNTLRFSALEAAINSHFSVRAHGQRAGIGTILCSLSVAPLSPASSK